MEFTSRFPELGFYVDGELKKFSGGRYLATSDKEIEVLNGLSDAVRVEKEVPKKAEDKPEKPAPKNSAK